MIRTQARVKASRGETPERRVSGPMMRVLPGLKAGAFTQGEC